MSHKITRVEPIRAGYYRIHMVARTSPFTPVTWDVEQRREDPAYGKALLWYATCIYSNAALDPLPTLRAVKAALMKL